MDRENIEIRERKEPYFKIPYDFDVNNDGNEKDGWEDEIYND